MNKAKTGILTAALVLAAFTLAEPLMAQGGPDNDRRWMIYLGGFNADTDTRIQTSDPEFGLSPEIPLEDDLGVDDNATTLRLRVSRSLGANNRHILEFQYLQIDRDGSIFLEDEIEYGDEIFLAGADVKTNIRTEDFDLHYTYLLVNKERGAFGVSAGLHGIRVEARVKAELGIAGLPVVQVQEEVREGEVPLPLIGIRGRYDFSSRWIFSAAIKLLDATFGDIEGRFLDSWAQIEYVFSDTISLGVGYAILNAEYDKEPDGSKAEIVSAEYEYEGIQFFARFRF